MVIIYFTSITCNNNYNNNDNNNLYSIDKIRIESYKSHKKLS